MKNCLGFFFLVQTFHHSHGQRSVVHRHKVCVCLYVLILQSRPSLHLLGQLFHIRHQYLPWRFSMMADSSWMRLLGAQRSRTPLSPLTALNPQSPALAVAPSSNMETSDALQTAHSKTIPRLSSWYGRGTSASFGSSLTLDTKLVDSAAITGQEDSLLVKEADRVWHNPSADQMADALRAAIMTRPITRPLPPEYNSFVLHLIESYGASQKRLAEADMRLADAEAHRRLDTDTHTSQLQSWVAKETQYKAEIKRLELLIHQTSSSGLEAVMLARSGSLVNRQGRVRVRSGAVTVADPHVRGSGHGPADRDQDENVNTASSENGWASSHRGSICEWN